MASCLVFSLTYVYVHAMHNYILYNYVCSSFAFMCMWLETLIEEDAKINNSTQISNTEMYCPSAETRQTNKDCKGLGCVVPDLPRDHYWQVHSGWTLSQSRNPYTHQNVIFWENVFISYNRIVYIWNNTWFGMITDRTWFRTLAQRTWFRVHEQVVTMNSSCIVFHPKRHFSGLFW